MDSRKIVVLGIGNPLFGDDAVGLEIVRRLKERARNGVDFVELHAGGLAVAEAIRGYRKAIIIDAICLDGIAPGNIFRYTFEDIKRLPRYFLGFHDVDIITSIELLKSLDENFPSEIVFYVITINRSLRCKEGLSKKIRYIISKCVSMVEKEID